MRLRVTARLDEAAVKEILDELLPITIDLAEEGEAAGERWLRVDKPQQVDFVEGEGLRVVTSARVRWRAAGMRVPVTLKGAELMIRPVVDQDDLGAKLLFVPSVEKTDFKLIPGFLDRRIETRINDALEDNGHRLAWHFGQTLAATVAMPASMAPVEAFLLSAEDAEVSVTADALMLSLVLGMRFARREGDGGDDIMAL